MHFANIEQRVTFGPFRMLHLAEQVDDRFRRAFRSYLVEQVVPSVDGHIHRIDGRVFSHYDQPEFAELKAVRHRFYYEVSLSSVAGTEEAFGELDYDPKTASWTPSRIKPPRVITLTNKRKEHSSASIPTIVTAQHCFIADPQTLELGKLSAIARPGSINLNDFGLGHANLLFTDLPECPTDFLEEGSFLMSTISIAGEQYVDEEGWHSFHLLRFKPSCLSLFAQLAEHQFEDYARRWCNFGKCDVFRFRRGISSEVDYSMLKQQTQEGLKRLLAFFCPLCRQALTRSQEVYVLHEWHEYGEA